MPSLGAGSVALRCMPLVPSSPCGALSRWACSRRVPSTLWPMSELTDALAGLAEKLRLFADNVAIETKQQEITRSSKGACPRLASGMTKLGPKA